MTGKSTLELERLEAFALRAARNQAGPRPEQRRALLSGVLAAAGTALPQPDSGVPEPEGDLPSGVGPQAHASEAGVPETSTASLPAPRPSGRFSILRPKAGAPGPTSQIPRSVAKLPEVSGSLSAQLAANAALQGMRLKLAASALGGVLVGLAVGSPGVLGLWQQAGSPALVQNAPQDSGQNGAQETDEAARSETVVLSLQELAQDQESQVTSPANAPGDGAGPTVAQSKRLATSLPRSGQSLKALLEPVEEDASASGSSPFYQELSYLRRAQAALRRGEGAYALGLMESLDQIQKDGALTSERSMTKVLALCQLGRAEEATVLAGQLLTGDPQLPYVERLRGSCADVTSLDDAASVGKSVSDQEALDEETATTQVEGERSQVEMNVGDVTSFEQKSHHE